MSRRPPHFARRLVLETPVQSPDGAGGFNETWVGIGQLWAEIKAGTGKEIDADYLARSYVPYRITVRAKPYGWPSRPRPDQRFREGARVFRIIAVAETGTDGKYLTCFTREEEVAA